MTSIDTELTDNTSLPSEATAISSIATETEKSSGIKSIGINGTSLIFQIINFIILFLLLRKFLFKPVAKMLDQRRQAIEDSLVNAKHIEQQKLDWEIKQKKLFDEVNAKSAKIIEEAKASAKEIKDKIIFQSKKEQEDIITSTKKEIEAIKEKSLASAKKELVSLVVLATKKVTENTIDLTKDSQIVAKTIKEVK